MWEECEQLLVVHFHYKGCSFSNQTATLLASLAEKHYNKNMTILNFEIDPEVQSYLIAAYKVSKYPTIVFYDYGQEIERLETIVDVRTKLEETLKGLTGA